MARLQNRSKKYDLARHLETLHKVSQSIVQGVYLREILQLIVTITAETMHSKICSLMLLDEAKGELVIEATQTLSEEYRKKPPLKVGQSVSGRALKEQQPITVLDVTKDPLYTYPDIARKEGVRSLLSVPMLVKHRPIGVINCYTTEEHRFTDEEVRLLQAVSNQAAIAIENTNLLEKATAAQAELEARKVVERAKGILMRQHHLTEEAAFKLIQRQAMNHRKTMREVAEAVLLAAELKA
ncbi:MAG: GAF and ANTAR domain-containing protein [Elusimicrobia bacterium]|nr:GAF and ANTAR domain-containing protein [Elusimicrobiota bacterium]